MTQKQLRQIARQTLASFLEGTTQDVNLMHAAIQVLNAPDRKGE